MAHILKERDNDQGSEATVSRFEKGFTLVEILIAIAMMGILSALTYQGFEMLHRHRLNAAAMQLFSDLQKSRQDALTKSQPQPINSRGFGLRFNPDSTATSYLLFEFDDCNDDFDYDADGCSSNREEASVKEKTLPRGVTMRAGASAMPANEILLYDKRGVSRTENWGMKNLTVVLQHPDVSPARCIAVTYARVREGLWNGSACNN